MQYLRMVRPHHWSKNAIVLFGVLIAALYLHDLVLLQNLEVIKTALLIFLASAMISSGNYILNDLIDMKYDLRHPKKKERLITSRGISKTEIICWMIGLWTTGIIISWFFGGIKITIIMLSFLLSAYVYNVRPVRLKDIPFLDAIVESINNPMRFLMGWFILMPTLPLIWVLIFLWAYSAFLMTGKRLAEFIYLGKEKATYYRVVFKTYSRKSLSTVMILHALITITSLFLISQNFKPLFNIVTVMIAIQLVWYFILAFKKNELLQTPELIYKDAIFTIYWLIIVIVGIYLIL